MVENGHSARCVALAVLPRYEGIETHYFYVDSLRTQARLAVLPRYEGIVIQVTECSGPAARTVSSWTIAGMISSGARVLDRKYVLGLELTD